jgi:MFS transporter, DHA3 family, macrolide efflux protein
MFKNKNILFLWIGHLISHTGDAIYMMALPWLILDFTGSKSSTALVTASVYLPSLIFGLFAGSLVDRYSRKRIMLISDILRAIIVLLIPLIILTDNHSTLIIGIIAFLLSTAGTPFYPARDSLIPSLVPAKKLSMVNSFISTSGQLSHLMGPVFAGIFVGVVGLTHLFTLDAITFLFSFIFIWLISNNEMIIKKSKKTYFEDIKSGLQFIKNKKGILALIIMTSVNNLFIMGPAIIGMPVFVREILNSEFITLAKIESAMALGMLLGSFIIIRFLKNISLIKILFFGIIFDGITYSILYNINSELITILTLFIHGIGIPFIVVSRTNLIQKHIPNELRGRVFSMVNMSVLGTTAISSMITGFALEYISSQLLFLIIGFGAVGTSLIGLFSNAFLKLEKIEKH